MPRDFLVGTLHAMTSAEPSLRARLEGQLSKIPIEKPPLHRGSAADDLLPSDLTAEEMTGIIDELAAAEASAVAADGSTTALASHYAALLDRWNGYLELASSC